MDYFISTLEWNLKNIYVLEGEGRIMWIECQKLLTRLKEYEADTLDWIREHGEEHQELTAKLQEEHLSKVQEWIKTLEEMKPGTIVEVR